MPGIENEGLENAGPFDRGWKRRDQKMQDSLTRGWKMQEMKSGSGNCRTGKRECELVIMHTVSSLLVTLGYAN